ncbi:MAG: ketoacyl-ACP synthase III [Flavobacteriales bacterium]|nr:ketoacyl-ACP synthase III [Flavobacteriales bacterium]
MGIFKTNQVSIKGIASAVPEFVFDNASYDWIPEQDRKMLIQTTGISHRRIAKKGTTTSDLCLPAAEKLIQALQWEQDSIGLIVFVSQSRDYVLPSTAILLQDKLGLKKSAMAFDVPLGCSGYVYGLSIVSSLMQSGVTKRALLAVGDISTMSLNYRDKSTYPLFGDAGTVTALEYDEEGEMLFNLGSDGAGFKAIMIPDGAARHPYSLDSEQEKEVEGGIFRKGTELILDGLEVFSFSVREVPKNVNELLDFAQRSVSNIDYFVMHQANKLMNETIRKKLKFDSGQVPYSLDEFGNTSSASIPLTITERLGDRLKQDKAQLLLSGFGVGLSWGSVLLSVRQLVLPDLIIYK